jgi:hypothetical protein
MEGTIREFEPLKPFEFWFAHPCHTIEQAEYLATAKADGEEPPWKAEQEAKKQKAAEEKERFMAEYNALAFDDGKAMVGDLVERLGGDLAAVKRRIKGAGLVLCDDDAVRRKEDAKAYDVAKAIESCMGENGEAPWDEVQKALKLSVRPARQRVDDHPGYERRNGVVVRVEGATS